MSLYALDQLVLTFDPSSLSAADLALTAEAYAQAAGLETEGIEAAVMAALVDLTEAHAQVQAALARYESAGLTAQTAAGAYATGSGTQTAWYDAQSAEADARAQLCTALAQFTRLANGLNETTGGWVSRTYDWQAGALDPLFQAAMAAETPADGETEEAPAGEAGEAEDAAEAPAGEEETSGETPAAETEETDGAAAMAAA